MPIDVKKARQAIDNAQHAGRQAKYFLKFMEALNNLDDCLADLGGIEGQALAAEKRKTEAEHLIPDLEKRVSELQHAKATIGNEHQSQLDAMERDVREKHRTLDAALQKQHEDKKAHMEQEIKSLEASKAALEGEVHELLQQRKSAETAIRRINQSLQKAGQTLAGQPNA